MKRNNSERHKSTGTLHTMDSSRISPDMELLYIELRLKPLTSTATTPILSGSGRKKTRDAELRYPKLQHCEESQNTSQQLTDHSYRSRKNWKQRTDVSN